jgi:hypothetical protein
MDYTAFFQESIEQHQSERRRHRQLVRAEHDRISGLLRPLLSGLDEAFSGATYESYVGDETIRGPLQTDEYRDDEALQRVFSLKCQGIRVVSIELTGAGVYLKNGIMQTDWTLRQFDERAVEGAARSIAECLVPHVVKK